jgi:hypothetical protein
MKDVQPRFEISRQLAGSAAYLVSYDRAALRGVVAEIELSAPAALKIDPALTLLTDRSGTRSTADRTRPARDRQR